MIAVIQRCSQAQVSVGENIVGKIDVGLLVLLGVFRGDTKDDANFLINKISKLRIFNDHNNKMNLSINDINGSVLVVSQFTLCGDISKGNRPSFINAATPDEANRLYVYFIEGLERLGLNVESGKFGTTMDVQLVNNGPVTFVLNSED